MLITRRLRAAADVVAEPNNPKNNEPAHLLYFVTLARLDLQIVWLALSVRWKQWKFAEK